MVKAVRFKLGSLDLMLLLIVRGAQSAAVVAEREAARQRAEDARTLAEMVKAAREAREASEKRLRLLRRVCEDWQEARERGLVR